MKKFLTVFLPAQNVHLYKDVGMIPYCIARFYKYQSAILYASPNQLKKDDYYEKFVKLIHIKTNNNFLMWIKLLRFVLKNAKNYNVINFYHLSILNFPIPILFKLCNPKCCIYMKLDLDEVNFSNLINRKFNLKRNVINFIKKVFVNCIVDLISVETKLYYDTLSKVSIFKNKLIYLPNGILIEKDFHEVKKENIILTVGRIGTIQKNNELLVEAITHIPFDKLKEWKVYFVGPVEKSFLKYLDVIFAQKPWLKDILIIIGNVEEKDILYKIYAKSKIFCLTSRWEGFPLVVPEAMYFGNYVITTDFIAAYDLTDNQRVGKIIESENVNMLAESLQEAIEDIKSINIKKEQAQEYITQCFMWNDIVKKISDFTDEERK